MDTINDNIMNIIKLFNGYKFIGKFDNVTFDFDDQHRTSCAVYRKLMVGLLCLLYTREPCPV